MKKTMSFSGAILLLPLALIVLYVWGIAAPNSFSAEDQASLEIIRPIPTAEAVQYLPKQSFRYPGKVKAAHRAALSFQVAGQIEKLNVLEGQQVKKGEILSQLDQKSLAYAVKAARAKFLASKQDYARASELFQEKVISKAQLDSAHSAFDIARAELDIQEKFLADSRLVAPFDGLIAKRYVERKEHVAKGKPVLLLQDIAGIEVEVQLPEQLVARGGTDVIDRLQVSFDACPDQVFAASAMELSMESSKDTGTYTLVITLPSPPDRKILPGMTATVTGSIISSADDITGKHAVLVPVEAVAFTPDSQAFVWVVDAQTERAQKRRVTVGAMHDNSIELTTGVQAKELVAVAGLNSLNEKQRVRPMKAGKQGLEG